MAALLGLIVGNFDVPIEEFLNHFLPRASFIAIPPPHTGGVLVTDESKRMGLRLRDGNNLFGAGPRGNVSYQREENGAMRGGRKGTCGPTSSERSPSRGPPLPSHRGTFH